MKPNFVSLGAACAALGIGLGAFGAHALRGQIAEAQLAIWETATRYWLAGSLGMAVFGVWSAKRVANAVPGWLLLTGSVLFSASLFGLALGAPRVLGAVTPLGGLCLIAGFLSFAWAARSR
jgi:uncharacterized membrane protein YgdD (TMEM256/DUF423 family)